MLTIDSYGLVTEQQKGSYKYFVDMGDRMEVAESRTVYAYQASVLTACGSRRWLTFEAVR